MLYYNYLFIKGESFKRKGKVGEESRSNRKKRETKQHIQEVCEQLFVFEKSFENVTMREIAQRADVSVGSLYLYYRTKEDILSTIIAVFLQKHVDKIKTLLAEKQSGIEKLSAILDYFGELSIDPYVAVFTRIKITYSTLPKMLTSDASKSIIGLLGQLVDQVEEILMVGRNDGTLILADSPTIAASALMRLIISLFMSAGILQTELIPIPSEVLDPSPAGYFLILKKYLLRSFIT